MIYKPNITTLNKPILQSQKQFPFILSLNMLSNAFSYFLHNRRRKIDYLQTIISPVSFSCKSTSSQMVFHKLAKLITILPLNPPQMFLKFGLKLNKNKIREMQIKLSSVGILPSVSSFAPLPPSPGHVYNPEKTNIII